MEKQIFEAQEITKPMRDFYLQKYLHQILLLVLKESEQFN